MKLVPKRKWPFWIPSPLRKSSEIKILTFVLQPICNLPGRFGKDRLSDVCLEYREQRKKKTNDWRSCNWVATGRSTNETKNQIIHHVVNRCSSRNWWAVRTDFEDTSKIVRDADAEGEKRDHHHHHHHHRTLIICRLTKLSDALRLTYTYTQTIKRTNDCTMIRKSLQKIFKRLTLR